MWYINKSYKISKELIWNSYFNRIKIKKQSYDKKYLRSLVNRLGLVSDNCSKEVFKIIQPVGRYCYLPEKCKNFDKCFPNSTRQTTLELAGLPFDIKWKNRFLHVKNINLEKISNEFNITTRLKFAVNFFHENKTFVINKDKINNLLEQTIYPITFLDFESIMPYLPFLVGTSPFMPLLIQYSMSVIEKQGFLVTDSTPKSYISNLELGNQGTSCNFNDRKEYYRELMQKMFDDLPKSGTVFVYDNGFEASILRKIKGIVPQFSIKIDNLLSRMVDFMEVFKNHWYYHQDQFGSISLKKVLPLLVPELNYADLQVQDGGMAVKMFYHYLEPNLSEKNKDEMKQQLITYCNFDTYSMTRMFQNLELLVKNKPVTGHKKSGLIDRFLKVLKIF